jgi:IclR family transcriptional regulator, pca regulon regulatory protein
MRENSRMAISKMKTVEEEEPAKRGRAADPLMVMSVEKAFRVLSVFDQHSTSLSLSQIAAATEMDVSAAQRFTHTLTKLGYLRKDRDTKRFELTAKTLQLGYYYLRSNRLVERTMPYLLHLSKETEETVNLTVLDDTEIIFISRFMSRHMLNTNVIIGSRMPAYCTAPGMAILSRLPEDEAVAILERSDRKAYTPSTTWKLDDLVKKLRVSREQGYATAFDEFYRGDASIAAAVVAANNRPEGAINIAVPLSRFSQEEVVERFAMHIIAGAHSVSST